jgi:hypothetical protein
MKVSGIPRAALVAMVLIALVPFAVGTAWGLSWVTRHSETRTTTLAAATTIEVRGTNGDIAVVGSDRTDVALTTRLRSTLFGRPHVRMRYVDGRLRLDGKCSRLDVGGPDAGCGVSYRLQVPIGTTVRLVTQSGDVSAQHVRGDADLQTSSGDVAAIDVVGTLRLSTISGDVDVSAPSRDIAAATVSGDVEVHALDAERVRAQTTSGDVDVRVPDRVYAVQTRAVSGDEHVRVRTDPHAPRSIHASTTSGDVDVSLDG